MHNQFTEERVDLSTFNPACLPAVGQSFNDQSGFVYGELKQGFFWDDS